MRIGLYTDSDVYAGTEAHLFTLANGLFRSGEEVILYCPAPSPLATRAECAGIRVVPVAKEGLVDRNAIRTLSQAVRNGDIELIHSHNGRTQLNAALAALRNHRGVSVTTQHFVQPDHVTRTGPKAAFYKLAHHWVNAATAHFIAPSRAIKQQMLARGESRPHRITVVPHGIEPPNLDAVRSPAAVREQFGLSDETPLIVCSARLEREKDLETLVLAMEHVAASLPKAACLIAGRGSQQAPLEELIRSRRLERSVRLIGFQSDIFSIVRAANLYIQTSPCEPFGLALLEAMALGRPVIATDAGGPQEIVQHEVTGLLTPPGDPGAIAGAIVRLLNSPDEAEKMGEEGQRRYIRCFQTANMTDATRSVYRQTLVPSRATIRRSSGQRQQ